jgi:hypothetical protein
VSERRLEAERLADNGPQAAPKRFYEKMLDFRALGITSIVTGILGKLAITMASTVPALSFVGRTFTVISGVGFIATGIVGLTAMLWAVYCLIHFDDIRNANQTPFEALFSEFQNFSIGYRRGFESLREQEDGLPLTYTERNTIGWSNENDEVLRQYRCPITGKPIRHIAIDPHSGKMFERSAIVAWIDRYHTSPLTTVPLRIEELTPSQETQLTINNRLRELQEKREKEMNEVRQDFIRLFAARRAEGEENRGSEHLPATQGNL